MKEPATKAAGASQLLTADRRSEKPPAVAAAAITSRDTGSNATRHKPLPSGRFCAEQASEGGISPPDTSAIVAALLSPDTCPPH
jgi:hypothetical protein